MSGEHFSAGELPHEPVERLPLDTYVDVEKNIVYGTADVAFRNRATGEIFLGARSVEPQQGPWFVGGRLKYGKGIRDSAAEHVAHDLGLDLQPNRFENIAVYSTPFPVAGPDRENHGRHTVNATMCVELSPEEVEKLNEHFADGSVRDEYSGGAWYQPEEIAGSDTDFPFAVKQFVRDLHDFDLKQRAVVEEAYAENERRTSEKAERRNDLEMIRDIVKLGLSGDDAERLVRLGGRNTRYAVHWTKYAINQIGRTKAAELIEAIQTDQQIGDFTRKRRLRERGITPPNVADNAPTLGMILSCASELIKIDTEQRGQFLEKIKPLDPDRRIDPFEE